VVSGASPKGRAGEVQHGSFFQFLRFDWNQESRRFAGMHVRSAARLTLRTALTVAVCLAAGFALVTPVNPSVAASNPARNKVNSTKQKAKKQQRRPSTTRKRRTTASGNVAATVPTPVTVAATVVPPTVPATIPASVGSVGSSVPVVASTVAGPSVTVTPPVPAKYLADALAFVERYWVRRSTVDVRAITDKARAAGAGAKSVAELYPVLRQVVKDLGDRHSAFLDPVQARSLLQGSATGYGMKIYPPDVIWVVPGSPAELAGIRTLDRIVSFNGKAWATTNAADRVADSAVVVVNRRDVGSLSFTMQRSDFKNTETPVVRALDARLGYIDLPGATGKPDDEIKFVAAGTAGVAAVEQQISPCGWVVDLRRNSGGFPFSMMSPLEPFLPEQVVGGFVYGDEKRENLRFSGGKFFVDNRLVWDNSAAAVRLRDPNVPVAVLTSNQTGSAGEIAAIAFIGRPSSRSFGVPTVGVTSANVGITLPDGSFIMVTHSYDLDRAGNVYDGPLKPDEVVPIDWGTFGTAEDPVVNQAKAWLGSQPACAGR
jgi:carboxyl-terminal processing protease